MISGDHQPLQHDAVSCDVIIVGAGTAGCVLADRLSEDGSLRILLIEAGRNRNDDPKVKTPLMTRALMGNNDCDWQFVSVPQEGLNGRSIRHARGKLIGGSSAINNHALIYPSKAQLNAWADLGNPGWDWMHMESYYSKFQTICTPTAQAKNRLQIDYLGSTSKAAAGPINASFPKAGDFLQQAWIETFKRLDYAVSEDPLSGNSIGGLTASCAINPELRERSHAGNTYLERAMARSNLQVIEGALTEKVLLDDSRGDEATAIGVQYTQDGRRLVAKARREVILCAGVFQSPQLLELSGIGSSKHLEIHGIEVVVDNPHVGENLQDHPNCGPSIEVKEGIPTMDDSRDPAHDEGLQKMYQERKEGPLGEGATYQFAYQPLQMFNTEAENKGIEKLLMQISTRESESSNGFPSQKQQYDFIKRMISDPQEATATIYMSQKQRHMDKSDPKEIGAISSPGNFISIIAMLAHPFSRGNVHITSPDPSIKPAIDFKYMTHPMDVEILARHICSFEKLITCEPLASYIKPGGIRLPASFPQKKETAEQAMEMIRACASTNYHPCGTCAMISRELGGVVNDKLVVYGTKNLRVCDASVFPIIPRGNILSTVYAVAEKGADTIKQDLKAYE